MGDWFDGDDMTDLEITRLCAEAMGEKVTWAGNRASWLGSGVIVTRNGIGHAVYDPFHDDAQAMALMKAFFLSVTGLESAGGRWIVRQKFIDQPDTFNESLNRAICECVAKMQLAKKSERAA